MVIVIRGTPNVILQKLIPVLSSVIDVKIKTRIDPKNMPAVMNSCWNTPKNPDSSNGAISLIIKGTTALKIPAHIPCPNLISM